MSPYVLILQTALGVAKQIQLDHQDQPGDAKFGMMIDVLGGIFGEADVSKYKTAITLVVTLAVGVWKSASKFGFVQKVNAVIAKV